jgi:Short C-terminal domain
MLPNRSDYKNKKEYKWARKQAQIEELQNGTGIASARGWVSFLTFFALGLAFKELGFGVPGTLLALGAAIIVFRLVPPAPIIQEQIEREKREEVARGPKWKNGTMVKDASGRKGTVKMAVVNRPSFYHVQFDDGTMEQIEQVRKVDESVQAVPVAVPAVSPPDALSSPSAELQRLADLHRDGSLTAEEFEAAKAKVLG